MAETLFIRLGSQAKDTIHWLIKNDVEQAIIASGELPNAGELIELTEKATTRQTIVFVPAADVLLKSFKVPATSAKAIRQAAPYMLEDDLAEDVEQLFFAYGDSKADTQGHNCYIAAVSRQQLQQWQLWLNQANIVCKHMIPDALALPKLENQYSAVMLAEQILLRRGAWQAMSVDVNMWPMVIKQLEQANDEENTAAVIATYSPLPECDQLPVDYLPEELPLLLLAEHYSKTFNLLQGEFQVKEKRLTHYTHWLWVASFAVIALILNFVLKGSELYQLSSQQAVIEKQIIQTYKSTFPNVKRVKITTIRSQLKQKLKGIGSVGSHVGFLSLLNKLEPALANNMELKPQTIKFDGKRQEIRMQAIAKDYQYFEQFKVALEKAGLTVNLGAQNNQGDQISGSFSITDSLSKERS